jgi:hypothetical protein
MMRLLAGVAHSFRIPTYIIRGPWLIGGISNWFTFRMRALDILLCAGHNAQLCPDAF